MKVEHVAIVGGGFSGVLLAINVRATKKRSPWEDGAKQGRLKRDQKGGLVHPLRRVTEHPDTLAQQHGDA